MSESITHQALVVRLVQWVTENVKNPGNAIVLSDASGAWRGDKPPSIGPHTPDVFHKSIDGSEIVIGEAKTANDIETRHSREQFRSYLLHLKRCPEGTLVVAVPWYVVRQGKSLIRALQKETNTTDVKVMFIEMLPG